MTAVKVENSNDRLMPNKGMPLSPPLSPTTTTTTIAGQSLKPSSLTYSPTSTPTKNKNKTTTDLLTDRNGILSDLKYDELKQSMQQQQQRRSFPMLLSFLPERVGDVDDLLEDGHAFSDICSSSSSSSSCSSLSASHHPSTEPALEPLVEIDEEEQHVISDDMGDASGSIPPLHLHARNGHHAEMSLSNSKLNNENDDDDDDILTDRLGMQDLDYNDMHQQQIVMHHRPSLVITERMCEESLDDCHAFSDLKMTRSSSSSNKSTTTTFSPVLIPSNGTSSVLTLPPLEEEKEDVEVCEMDVVVQAKE